MEAQSGQIIGIFRFLEYWKFDNAFLEIQILKPWSLISGFSLFIWINKTLGYDIE